MPIALGTKSIENVLFYNKQIDRVLLGDKVLWENWQPWSYSNSSTASIGWFGPNWDLSYTVPADTEVTYIYCNAGVYSHYQTANVIASIYVNGVMVAESRTGVADEGRWAYKDISYTPSSPLPAGTVIKVNSSGTSYRRSVSMSLTGRSKYKPATWTEYSTPVAISGSATATYGTQWSGVEVTSSTVQETKAIQMSVYYNDSEDAGNTIQRCPIEIQGYTGTSWVTLKSIPSGTFTKDNYYSFTSDLPDVVCTQYKAIVSNNRVDLWKKIGPIKLLVYKRKA